MIDERGGLTKLMDHPIRVENQPYMRLVIEHIGTGPRSLPHISVCHYGEQNGDLMRDPDMTFEIAADGRWLPVSYRNDYVGKDEEAVWQDEHGTVLCRPRLVMELQSFARTWDKNIGEQGFVQAAKALGI
jgi:hypothetical protein